MLFLNMVCLTVALTLNHYEIQCPLRFCHYSVDACTGGHLYFGAYSLWVTFLTSQLFGKSDVFQARVKQILYPLFP
jgi:hypothetical protein